MITDTPSEGDVSLVCDGRVATIYFDENDQEVVGIAARDFAADVQRVTGVRPAVTSSLDALDDTAVIIGTVGVSAGVEASLAASDVDPVTLAEKRESFVIATVEAPMSGVDSCVLIVGSDRRGTAYGVYELSRRVGVSPWYWWADVAPAERESLIVEAMSYREGPPVGGVPRYLPQRRRLRPPAVGVRDVRSRGGGRQPRTRAEDVRSDL